MEEISQPSLDILSWLNLTKPLYIQGLSRMKGIRKNYGLKHTKLLFHLSAYNKGMDRRNMVGGF
jgi:hypothetical protein